MALPMKWFKAPDGEMINLTQIVRYKYVPETVNYYYNSLGNSNQMTKEVTVQEHIEVVLSNGQEFDIALALEDFEALLEMAG